MSLLSPLFLLGALAVAVPIVLHLLRRAPEPKLQFAAVRLLHHAPVEHTARRRLRERLLLALRVAALLLLAFAFARPFLPADGGDAPRRATVVAMDRSLSMSAPATVVRVRELALETVAELPAGEPVGLVTFDHEATVVEPPTTDRARVRAAIADVEAGPGGTRYGGAVAAAFRSLDGRPGSIVVITDLQAGGWGEGDAAEVPTGVAVEVRDTGRPPPNIAVTDLAAGAAGVTATLRNTGTEARDVSVHLMIDDRPVDGRSVRVPPDGSAQAEFAVRAGGTEVAVRVDDPDGAQGDNVRYGLLAGAARRGVALVSSNGLPGHDALYVEQALVAAPPGSAAPFRVFGVAADALDDGAGSPLDGMSAVVLVSTRGLEPRGRERLAAYLRAGGGMLVSAGPDVDAALVAEVLAGAGRIALASVEAERVGRALAPTDPRHPAFAPFRESPVALGAASFDRIVNVEAGACRTLARFTTGEAALVECEDGRGRAMVFASDMDGAWNDWPKRATFVPWLRASIDYLASAVLGASALVTDRPAGAAVPGIYTVPEAAGTRRIVVNADPSESDPARLTPVEFLSAITTAPATAGPPLGARQARDLEEGQGLWWYALWLVLALLVAESVVSARTR